MHASIILAHDIVDYASLFAEIADAYFEKGMYSDARPVYEALGADASVRRSSLTLIFDSDIQALISSIRQVVCTSYYRQLRVEEQLETIRKPQKCMSTVRHVWYLFGSVLTLLVTVISVDPSNNDAKMKLAEIYEIMNEPRKALDLVYQGTLTLLSTFMVLMWVSH